ncbi:ComEA family DNA-binding protein [Tsukamurella paurometabola]|uniref:ComEA family DNA-binding protein n=1 Tax=Tsukamurella paurometabola TaxID=2061 RepID=A0ABS5N9P9_TSUPA|nr:ComEA family DNA-binding protein [Tsukamurella paurometabola]MBS4100994.1 ComEA family DNA-binding protein [Tsukamurella paurometabola]
MNGEREAAAGSGVADEQIFARPAWLDDFAPARREYAEPVDPGRDGDGRGTGITPSRRVRMEDDDFWDEQEPVGWRSTVERVRTTPRAAIALVVVGVIAAVVAAVTVLGPSREGGGQYPVVDFAGASSSAEPSAPSGAAASAGAGAATGSGSAPSDLVVAVVGLVRAPGLHRLQPGARVADALTAARGTLGGADTASLNLAQPLRDGDQVVVGVVDPKAGVTLRSSVRSGSVAGAAGAPSGAPGGSVGGAAGGADAAGAVNINTASAAELDRLPGVGAATAAAIIAYRDKNGPFRTVDDLAKVSGIGEAKLAKIKPMATV